MDTPRTAALRRELLRRIRTRKLYRYQPYPKQFEFHALGARFRERGLFSGNQNGKTYCAGAEAAMHATGQYPPWWPGIRYPGPTLGWTGSISNEKSRDVIQHILFGTEAADQRHQDFGTGMIPGDHILSITRRQAGVQDVIDQAFIRHISGGISRIALKAYEQGWQKFTGKKVDWVWLDEEPEKENSKIYSEALTRTQAADDGRVWITFTPLNGMTPITANFQQPKPNTTPKAYVTMTIHDVAGGIWPPGTPWEGEAWEGHYTKEEIPGIINAWPSHERKTRSLGVPMAGEGMVYPLDEDEIKIAPFPIPRHFARIIGIDFGINEDHPFARVALAWDRDADVIYVYDAYKRADLTPEMHAPGIRALGEWIPVAWPHDGINREKTGGEALMQAYVKAKVLMIPISARYEEGHGGRQAVEPAALDILERMQTGRFKVFAHLDQWFSEFRVFHRSEGQIVSVGDDLMKATIYAKMMIRHARPEPVPVRPRQTRPMMTMWGSP